ncbi:LysR family transcriptional regulator [Paracoccus ravus]|uniref:LysR family transcriptional regulator n=1 Tax=Paracoccus ravus TaxID=2447760 RepID=UPI00106EE093|nr:LysR family transcriptional regulator [Paracoccus ravus]
MKTSRELGDELVSRGIKLRQLALIVAVERCGQLSMAAAMMNITQPAASRLLSDLERIVGAELTRRHSRGISLTAAGERLAARARSMLRDLDIAGREVRDIDRGMVGSVNLGSVTGPSLDLVLPIVRGLEQAEPNLRVRIDVETSDRLAGMLLAGQLDLYLGRVPDRVDAALFDLAPVGPEPLSLIVRADHPLVSASGATLRDCLGFDWVIQPPGSMMRVSVERYLLDRGLGVPGKVIDTSSLMLTMAFVMQSDAIGITSRAAARLFASVQGQGGRIACLDVAPELEVPAYSIVTLRDRVPTSAAQTFLTILQDALRNRGADA